MVKTRFGHEGRESVRKPTAKELRELKEKKGFRAKRRKPGRPEVWNTEGTTQIRWKLPTVLVDKLKQKATVERKSLSEIVGEIIKNEIGEEE